MTNFMVGTIQTTEDAEEPSRKHHHLEFVSKLTPEEYNKLSEALRTLNGFMQDSQLFMMATWNFNEFMELIAKYLQAYIKKDINNFVQKPIKINLNRAFLNLLSSIRSYLDFMERLLKKRYGEESVLFSNFKKSCSREYDGYFSYRFLYNLRHYAQHKGFPISNISWGQRPDPNDPRKAIFYLEVFLLRDEILNDFDWRGLENEVKDLPEKIDIIQHTLVFMEALSRIHVQVINDLFHTLIDSAQQIILFSERLTGKEGEPVVFEFEGDVMNIRQLSHTSIPIKLAQHIVDGQLVDVLLHFENTAA